MELYIVAVAIYIIVIIFWRFGIPFISCYVGSKRKGEEKEDKAMSEKTFECRKCCETEDEKGCIFKIFVSCGNPDVCPFSTEGEGEWIPIDAE